MRFNILLEKATILYDYGHDPSLRVCPVDGDVFTPVLAAGDGYSLEIAHFIKTAAGQKVAEITTPEESMNSVKIIMAEKESADSGNTVSLG